MAKVSVDKQGPVTIVAIDRFAEHYRPQAIDAIAAAEARGFLFAAPLALELSKPLVPLRKPGKLPFRTYSLKYDLEYGSAEFRTRNWRIESAVSISIERRADSSSCRYRVS